MADLRLAWSKRPTTNTAGGAAPAHEIAEIWETLSCKADRSELDAKANRSDIHMRLGPGPKQVNEDEESLAALAEERLKEMEAQLAKLVGTAVPELKADIEARVLKAASDAQYKKLEAMVVAVEGVANDELDTVRKDARKRIEELKEALRSIQANALSAEDVQRLEQLIASSVQPLHDGLARKVNAADLDRKLSQLEENEEYREAFQAIQTRLAQMARDLKGKADMGLLHRIQEELQHFDTQNRPGACFGRLPVTGQCLSCDRPVNIKAELDQGQNSIDAFVPMSSRLPNTHSQVTAPSSARERGVGTSSRASGVPHLPTNFPRSSSSRSQRYYGGASRLYEVVDGKKGDHALTARGIPSQSPKSRNLITR